jgi:hypothetical protein
MSGTPEEATFASAPRPEGGQGAPPPQGAAPPADLEARFRDLVQRWKAESLVLSSVTAMARLPSYQAIIELGPPVIPLLLRELEQDPDHWFWALKTLTGVDPVPEGSRGRLPEMARAWVRWGREQGYRW